MNELYLDAVKAATIDFAKAAGRLRQAVAYRDEATGRGIDLPPIPATLAAALVPEAVEAAIGEAVAVGAVSPIFADEVRRLA